MKYLDSEWIVQGPHDASAVISFYRGKIDDSILYLYSILPYIDTGGAMDVDFYDGGEFTRFDDGSDVDVGRNPLYAEEEERMMQPWMTPLSQIGNHCTTIIYGFNSHSIWIFHQISDGPVDPGLRPSRRSSVSDNEHGVRGENQSKDGDASDNDSDNGSEEDELEYGDYFRLDNCRPAGEVLRDINKWYKTLKHLPGGGEHSPIDWDQTLTGPLYVKHGWLSGDFNGDAFQIGRIRSYTTRDIKERAKSAAEDLESLMRTESGESDLQALKSWLDLQSLVSSAWNVYWRLLVKQVAKTHSSIEPEQQQDGIERVNFADTLTPGEQDLPLWETEWLKVALRATQKSLRDHVAKISKADAHDSNQDRANRLQLKYKLQEVEIYQQAYKAAKVDAERLCPGQTFTSITGSMSIDIDDSLSEKLKSLGKTRENNLTELIRLQSFLNKVPQEAMETRHKVELRIQTLQSWIQNHYPRSKEQLERLVENEKAAPMKELPIRS